MEAGEGPGPQKETRLTWRSPLVRLKVLVSALLIAFLCYGFFTWVLWPVKVSGQSMMPNYPDGSRHFINKLAYLSSEPQRGDVIGLRIANGEIYIKRIVGVPGERVRVRDGGIFINGRRLHETYTEAEIPWDLNNKSWLLGTDQYFVIGDNRATSIFVAVPRRDIIGKIVY